MTEERLVICPLDGDHIADGPVHRPATYKLDYPDGAPPRRVLFTELLARGSGVPPYEWPTRCGKIGLVYAHDGVLSERAECPDCANGQEIVPVDSVVERLPSIGGAFTRDDVIAALRVAAARGRVTRSAWARERPVGSPSMAPIVRLFGSWSAAMQAAGLAANKGGKRRRIGEAA